MRNRTRVILDGKSVKPAPPLLEELTPGVTKRRGAFETMRVVNGRVADVELHLARLARGLRVLGIRNPYSTRTMERWLRRAVLACGSRRARLRLSVWRDGPRRRAHGAVVCQPYTPPAEGAYRKGYAALITQEKRPLSRTSTVKSLDYGVFRRAALEAKQARVDEAILLNGRGELVEGSRTNLFYVKRGVLYTPAVACGALNGITRRQVIAGARALGLPWRAVAAEQHQLLAADEAFVTNSLIGLMPLTKVNGRRIGIGSVGPLTRNLSDVCCEVLHLTCPRRGKSV